MKIGIYGGTFDPIHRGHLAAAKAAVEQLGLDQILLIPANVPPHKQLPRESAAAQDRYEMTVLGTAELKGKAQVLDLELQRNGKSYTSDTLRVLKEQYPEDELWLLLGTDMFLSLDRWHEPEVIMSLASIGAFSRTEAGEREAFEQQKQKLENIFAAHVVTMTIPDVVEISSTQVRRELAAGKGQDLVTDAVYGYILRRGLYGTHADLKHLNHEELVAVAMSYLKPKRMTHVRGVEQEAVHLAKLYGANVEDARVAALFHDCTKKLDIDQQLALCEKYGAKLDEMQRWALKLQHAITGAEVARHIYGVNDDVYEAIRWHTTGKADMTLLEKVIYMADYIEPNRDFPGVDELRQAVWEDLDRGLLMGLEMSIAEMARWGNPVHHDTLEARDYLAQQLK